MEEWLERLKRNAPGDKGIRLLVAGATVFLFAVVIIDALGARGRAILAQQTEREDLLMDDGSRATVPSVYRVPRDLASEVALAREAPVPEDEIDVVADDVIEDETAIAEAAPDEAAVDMAEAAEIETAEAVDGPDETRPEAGTEAAPVESEAMQSAEAAPAQATDDTATAVEVETAEVPDEVAETHGEVATEPELTADTEGDGVLAETETVDGTAPETEVAQADPAPAMEDDPGLALLASADPGNGQRVWRQCAACHVHDAEQNRGGPHLVGIIGRDVGVAEGWRYSRALSEHGGVWTVDALLAWLENPDTYIPGNQMAFRGLRDEQDRIDLLGFLNASRGN